MVVVTFDGLESSCALEDCYVSIKAGDGVQKLSRMSTHHQSYSFPEVEKDHKYGKIEIYRRIGSCGLQLEPWTGMREVHLSSREPGFSGLRVQIDSEAEQRGFKNDRPVKSFTRQDSLRSATDYLAKHSIQKQLSAVMKAVLQERPENPSEFIASRLLGQSHGRARLAPMNEQHVSTESAQDGIVPLPPRKPAMQRGRQQRGKKLPPLQAAAEPHAVELHKRDSLDDVIDETSSREAEGEDMAAKELMKNLSTSTYLPPSGNQPLQTSSILCEIAPVASEDTDTTRLSELKAHAGHELAEAMRSGTLDAAIKQEADRSSPPPQDSTRRLDGLRAQAGDDFVSASRSGALETVVVKLAQDIEWSTLPLQVANSLLPFSDFYRSHFRGARSVEAFAQDLFSHAK